MLPGLFIPFHRKGSGDMMSTFLSENKELLSEWDFEKNAELKLFPEKLTEGSNKKAWWKCKNGHTWQEPIYQRWQGKQCPFCTNKRVLVGYNDLPTLFPELAKEWDAEENKNIDLLSVVPGSSKTVNWKCSVCGYKWKTSIRQRTQRKTGCPECAKAKRATTRTKTILKHSGSVADFEIAKQWSHEKNIGLTPEQFSPSSNKSVWWKCPTCGYEWKAKICNRVNLGRGCPACANQVVIPGKNDLATLRPELAKEWHPSKNHNLTPEMVTPGSDLKVWWKCRSCGYEWQTSVGHRVNGTGCKRCYQERNHQNHPLSKKIHQYSLDGKFIQEWKSISEAARTLHISSSNITMCAKNLRNQAGGYRWKYPSESTLL